jgi:hypothetical protein
MIINNLLLKLKDRSPENITKAREVLLSMKGKIEVLVDLTVAANIRSGPAAYDILLIAKYNTMEDLEAYLIHPVHVEVGKYIAGVVESSASVCYRD